MTVKEHRRHGHGRRPLPADLPRRRIEYKPEAGDLICACCGKAKCKIGEETSVQLEYVPDPLIVLEHVRGKYACPHCDGDGVQTAEKPPQPIEKGLPGPGLLAHIVTSKYADHLPLYRQEDILARHGVEIPRSTMCGWMRACADLLRPLVAEMKARVLQSRVIHTDDTPVKVQDEMRERTREARFWVYVGDMAYPYTVFDYTQNRKRDGPANFLGDFSGYLQADAYAGYDALYTNGKVIEVACWAHARRKFTTAQATDAIRPVAALAYIRRLYDVEKEAALMSSAERRQARQDKAKPVLEEFGAWLQKAAGEVLPRSPVGEAVTYTLNNWAALRVYVEDGELDIDNNEAERAVKPVAIGRKNWLFLGSDNGGRTGAVLFSLISTCKRHEIDPFVYLRDVIRRISTHPSSRIEELLPGHWLPQPDPLALALANR